MDSDSEIRNVAPTDSLYNLNVRNAINAANKGKSLMNVLGNLAITKYILPYSGGTFPVGTNRCIGAVEDTRYNTIIFFVYNSLGSHQILRYYRDNTDPQNPFGEVQQITLFNFGWNRDTRITSINIVYGTPNGTEDAEALPGATNIGDLLYWCDPKPRKVNLTKGNICGKQKSWTLYAPKIWNSFAAATTFTFVLRNFLGGIIANVSIPVPIQATNQAGLEFIAAAINANYSATLSAEACDCSLTITEVGTNGFEYTNGGPALFMIPENWYGNVLIDRFFDHCKWPAMQAPQPLYAADAHFLPNYVSSKVFQFRLQYGYDDLEESVLGVWSQIAINNLQCDGTSKPLYNNIDVNFNDPALTNLFTLIILKKITFVARELNTGPDRAVIDLYPCDFLDYNGTGWYCHYQFYNDIVSDPVDVATASLLFDDVPITANAELVVKDRMVFAGTVNGYNPAECPALNLTVKLNEVASPKLYPVTFKIRILTFGLNYGEQRRDGGNNNFEDFFPQSTGARKYPFWQPPVNARGAIFHNILNAQPTDYAFWGGGSFQANGDFEIRAGMETTWGAGTQIAGFPVYTRNEPYFGISKQINVGLPTDGNNALDTSTASLVSAIGAFYNNRGDIYSTVTVMVPDGVHVFAVADPSCSFGGSFLGKGYAYDLNGSAYQRTSTNVMGYFDVNNVWQKDKEVTVTVSGAGVVDAGTFVVMDTSPPADANMTSDEHQDFWLPFGVYLYDSSANPLGQANDDMNSASYEGVPVEKAIVGYSDLNQRPGAGVSNWPGWLNTCATDHNGYWFGIGTPGAFSQCPNINVFDVGEGPQLIPNVTTLVTNSTTVFVGSLTDLLNKTLRQTNYASGGNASNVIQLIAGCITTTLSSSRTECSTIIKGEVVDQNNNPISQAGVIYTDGRTGHTDINGNFELVAWGDMITPNLANFSSNTFNITSTNDRVVDSLIYTISPLCKVTYPFGQIVPNIIIQFFDGNPFSPTFPVNVLKFIIDESGYAEAKVLKRGGNYQVGVRMYDDPARLCSVMGPFNLYIPFETEDLSLYPYVLQANGTPYLPGSYVEGQPEVFWSFGNSFTAPPWVATYQLMRTQKTNYDKFVRWVINGAQYVSQLANTVAGTPAIDTAYANGDAVAVLLDISNMVIFDAQNPGATIGYAWTEGDRVRLIFDRGNNLLESPSINLGQIGTMYDYPITGVYDPPVGNPNQLIVPIPELPFEIQSGFTVEIYTPKDLVDASEQIYYEVGDVLVCTNPGQPNNAFSVTSGQFINGDTYWRGRLIEVDDSVTDFAGVFPALIEDASVSDLYPSLAEDIGRPGTVDPTFVQLFQPSYMRATDTFLPSTGYNGLSRLPAASELVLEKLLDRRYGQIRRLFFEQNNLVAVMTSKEISNYINRQTIYNAQNPSGIQASTTDFFGTEFVHENNFGTDLPGSCVTNSGSIFGWTNQRANVWRYLSNGENAISDEKMISFFKQLSIDGVSDAVAVYDRYHEELIISYQRNQQMLVAITGISTIGGLFVTVPFSGSTFPLVNSDISIQYLKNGIWITVTGIVSAATATTITILLDVTGAPPVNIGQQVNVEYVIQETVAWFEGTKEMKVKAASERWITFYSYQPECLCALDSEIFSFVNGRIWIHDKNALYNNFYGVQYNTVVTPVFNEQPELTKVWNALWMLQFQDNGQCNWFSNNIFNNNYIHNGSGQLSRLKAANWQNSEEGWYTTFLRDLNDTVATIPILNGRYLRSSALVCQMTSDYTGAVTLYGWRANYSASERTSK